ncbi:MAG: flagellar hook-length control protein FliK [Defluviitaleaceae bacterium]|nr:flagellar hook-length control protein FliK [Defluviitaleaceae bacterium]
MQINNALKEVGLIAATQNQNQAQPQSGQSQSGFDLLFANASRNQSIDPTADMQNRNRDDDRGNRRSDDIRADRIERPDRVTRRENSNHRVNETTTTETPTVQDTSSSTSTQYEATSNEIEIDEEAAIINIAAVLQIPVEVVIELMNEQGMTAQDLLDTKAVTKFLQLALEAENPMALLTDPEFPEKFKAINEIMGELLQDAKAAQSVEVTAQVASQAQKSVAYAMNLEGLEVISEDGGLGIINEDVAKEIQSATSRIQTTHETSEQATEQQPQAGGGQTQDGTTSPLLADSNIIMDDQQGIDPMLNMNTPKVTVETQATRATTPAQAVNTADVIEQIMSQVKITQSSGGQFTEMRMTLRPDDLGDIVLRVLTQNGIVTAQFEAESQRVKEALESNFNQLRDALEEQGIAFSELSVSVRQDGDERANQFERERQRTLHRADTINGEEAQEESVSSLHNGVIDITA